MSGRGSADDAARRLEANLKTPRRLTTPLGTVRLGEDVYVRRDAGGAVLTATLDAAKGLVFKSRSQVSVELVALEAPTGPASLDDIKDPVGRSEHRVRNRLDLDVVLTVFSASGWSDEAAAYARNDPPGTGYAGRRVHLVLVGPAPSDVVMSDHDDVARSLRPVLRGRTDDEEETLAREALEKALTLYEYAVLERVVSESDLDPECIDRAAREMASRDGALKLDKVSGAGLVLRRKG